MENSFNKNINHPALFFVLMQVIFITMFIISASTLLTKSDKISPDESYASQPSISISNLPQTIPDFPVTSIDALQRFLLLMVQKNDSNFNLTNAKAVVRDDSIWEQYFPIQNMKYYSAIIDIPEINQSYQFFHQYSDDSDNKYLDPNDSIFLLCIEDPAKIIYQDFTCIDTYSQKTRNALVKKYLNFFNFNGIGVGINPDNLSQININILDPNVAEENQSIKEVRQAIQSLGVSPDLFEYNVFSQKDFSYYIEY